VVGELEVVGVVDELEVLEALDELEVVGVVGELEVLEALDELEEEGELKVLHELEVLGALDELEEEGELEVLDELEVLGALDGLEEEGELEVLDELQVLGTLELEEEGELEVLDELEELDGLEAVGELENHLAVYLVVRTLRVLHLEHKHSKLEVHMALNSEHLHWSGVRIAVMHGFVVPDLCSWNLAFDLEIPEIDLLTYRLQFLQPSPPPFPAFCPQYWLPRPRRNPGSRPHLDVPPNFFDSPSWTQQSRPPGPPRPATSIFRWLHVQLIQVYQKIQVWHLYFRTPVLGKFYDPLTGRTVTSIS